VILSREVSVVGENFHRHMESGAFWQEAEISRDCYNFKNERKTRFSEFVFITISLNKRSTAILQYVDKKQREKHLSFVFLCL